MPLIILFMFFMKRKKSGRRKGLKNKLSPEVTRKLGEANLHYAHGRYEEVICSINHHLYF